MYHQLKLKNFTKKNINKNYIDEDLLNKLLKKNIRNCPYNTFPYIFGNNSKQSLKKYKCGNCVAMSINLQNLLKMHNIKSYLIPATIPKMYYLPNFLKISHVAVIIIINEFEAYIIDPAFYFLKPMKINININTSNTIPWKHVYSGNVDILNYKINFIKNDEIYNKYQTIPHNTYSVETYESPDDKWNYYLIEVENPDKAITSFNLTNKIYPFLAKLDYDFNLKLYIKFSNKDTIHIKYKNETIYVGNVSEIPKNVTTLIEDDLLDIFGNNYKKLFKLPDDIENKIYNVKDVIPYRNKTKKHLNNTKKRKKVNFHKTIKYI
tara:strand:+ start:3021 stop:3983 length:963 start_codon:yes stop_codon:yes gene_type:complete